MITSQTVIPDKNGRPSKTCSKCAELKPLDKFYRDSQRSSGKSSECKDCQDRRHKEFYANNPERRRAINLKMKYGITPEEWDLMMWKQGQCCAVCLTDEPGNRGWQTDHCHETNTFRGILCFDCNIAIGRIEKGWKIHIPCIINYLDKFPLDALEEV